MTHLDFDRISAIADTDIAVAGADGRHLAECAQCREQLGMLRAIVTSAQALPRDVAPPPEAWDGIRARLATGKRPAAGGTMVKWMAAAAAVILVVGGALILPFGGSNPLKGAKPAVASAPAALVAVDKQYIQAVDELHAVLEAQRPTLARSVAGVVDKSLADIDAAISETRDLLRVDPENPALVDILSSNYERKVDLLQRATKLASTS